MFKIAKPILLLLFVIAAIISISCGSNNGGSNPALQSETSPSPDPGTNPVQDPGTSPVQDPVVITPKSWGTAELIETDSTGDALSPQIAFDSSGNAIAVWEQWGGSTYSILANRYTSGSGWGTPELIETDDTGDALNPTITFDSSGNAIAVWEQWDGSTYSILANRYTSGSGWGTPELIETDDTGDASRPQVAADSNGNAIAVWEQWDGSTNNIWANQFTTSSGWGTAELIETDDTGDAFRPQIAVGPNGNAIADWYQSDGLINNIWANRYTAGSGWGTAGLIETDDAGDALNPTIAVDSNGNAAAVWEQWDGLMNSIWANRYTAGSGWGTAGLIETDDTGNASRPQVAVDSNGNAIAVWYQWDGSTNNIWTNRYTAGSGWGTAGLIETDNTGDASRPQVAVDSNGNAIAVWYQSDGSTNNIWTNRYTAGSGWGTAGLIETDNAGNALNPRMAVDSNGNAIAVWQQHDGLINSIWTNSYK
ncbi:MAG: hypothetical protein HZB61_03225 [Nitrospirae bacterium]|nr:hypothetical protein [Nitrospirota bacterium]